MKILKFRKTNKNLKRVRFVKGLALFFVLDLVLLGLVGWRVCYDCRPLCEEDVQVVSGEISFVKTLSSRGTQIILYGVEKSFYYTGSSRYSIHEMDKLIHEGDFINIRYTQDLTLYGISNNITELTCEGSTYLTLNEYNEYSKIAIKRTWGTYILLNILIGGGVFLYVRYYKNIERIFD